MGRSRNARKQTQGAQVVPCKFFIQGVCQKGKKCPFKHDKEARAAFRQRRDEEPVRRAPQVPSAAPAPAPPPLEPSSAHPAPAPPLVSSAAAFPPPPQSSLSGALPAAPGADPRPPAAAPAEDVFSSIAPLPQGSVWSLGPQDEGAFFYGAPGSRPQPDAASYAHIAGASGPARSSVPDSARRGGERFGMDAVEAPATAAPQSSLHQAPRTLEDVWLERAAEEDADAADAGGAGDEMVQHVVDGVVAAVGFAGAEGELGRMVDQVLAGQGQEGDAGAREALLAVYLRALATAHRRSTREASRSRWSEASQRWQGSGAAAAAGSKPLCTFYLQGRCRFGAQCRNSHSLPPHMRDNPEFDAVVRELGTAASAVAVDTLAQALQQAEEGEGGGDGPHHQPMGALEWLDSVIDSVADGAEEDARAAEREAEGAPTAAPSTAPGTAAGEGGGAEEEGEGEEEVRVTVEQEEAESREAECCICCDAVRARGRKFGLMMECEHAFCLECIRAWRRNPDLPKHVVRTCPLCRANSFFVVPSHTLVRDGKRKRFLLAAYRAKLASIPCRHFDYGRGVCPFGDACFYAHLNVDGSVNRTQRTRIDKDGNVSVMSTPKLSDFLAPAFRAVDEMDSARRGQPGRHAQ